jgi:hypothetical protein
MGPRIFLAMLLAWSLCPSLAFSQNLTVQTGANLSLGSGTITLNCGDLEVAGVMAINSGTIHSARHVNIAGGNLSNGSGLISLSGNWTNSGTFTPGTGNVSIVDGCNTTTSAIEGNSTFYQFSASTAAGRTIQVASGSTQTFNRSLTLKGSTDNRLSVRSSQAGNPANFTLAAGGGQNISAVDVADNNAQGGLTLAPGTPESSNSVDSGGNANWFIQFIAKAVPVDTLPGPTLVLLAVLLLILSSRFQLTPGREKVIR